MKKTKLSLALAGLLSLSTSSFADDAADIAELTQQVKNLQEMTQTLTDETSDLQTGFNYTTVDVTKRYKGLGPAASKVYYSKSPLSIGGYGEMYLSSTKNEDGSSSSETQVKRFITYFGYKFSDSIVLNSEIEYEGGGVTASGTGDEVKVEFLYIDFMQNKNFNVRVGNFLVPMGLINEQHEPTLFTTVQRPSTAKYLIPSTWNESGVMVYGEIASSFEYKASSIVALQTSASGDKWIRDGRGGSFEVQSPSLAFTGRLDYTGLNGLLLGASAYYAPSASVANITETTDIFMFDAHLDYKIKGFRVYGVYTQTSRTNAEKIATVLQPAAEKANGAYLNLSYDVLTLTSLEYKLPLFIQYESVNAQSSVVDTVGNSVTRKATNTTTLGANFFPHEQVVLKVDYAMSTQADTISASLGFIF